MQQVTFHGKLEKSPNPGGWTYVVWPGAKEYFGTAGYVKIRGTIDGKPLRATFMAMGNGVQMLPVKAETRKLIGKEAGDEVEVTILERLDN